MPESLNNLIIDMDWTFATIYKIGCYCYNYKFNQYCILFFIGDRFPEVFALYLYILQGNSFGYLCNLVILS